MFLIWEPKILTIWLLISSPGTELLHKQPARCREELSSAVQLCALCFRFPLYFRLKAASCSLVFNKVLHHISHEFSGQGILKSN